MANKPIPDETVMVLKQRVELIAQHSTAEENAAMADYLVRKEGADPSILDREFQDTWTYGWKVRLGKDQYGDFVTMTDPEFEYARGILLEQAKIVIDRIQRGLVNDKADV